MEHMINRGGVGEYKKNENICITKKLISNQNLNTFTVCITNSFNKITLL